MKTLNFISIDFETFTAEHTSACAIGMAKVVNGEIIQKFYSLIHPVPDDRSMTNSFINGIYVDMVEYAPTFDKIFPIMCNFIGDNPIACHNRNMDIKVLESCMAYYGLKGGIDPQNNICTYELTKLSLEKCCEKYEIEKGCHHDALDDAVVCAKIALKLQGVNSHELVTHEAADFISGECFKDRNIDHQFLDPFDDNAIDNQDTCFFHSKCVITGIFDAFPERNDLAGELQKLGADINTAISKRTDIVLVGRGAGLSKMKKIAELQAQGFNIKIIKEDELIEILGHE